MDEIREVKCHTKLWKYERLLFSIGNVNLGRPIPFKTLGIGGATLLVLFILHRWFLPIPFSMLLVYYGGITFLVTKFLTEVNPEGKAIHKFLLGYLLFFTVKRSTLNRYKRISPRAKYRYPGTISYRQKGVDTE